MCYNPNFTLVFYQQLPAYTGLGVKLELTAPWTIIPGTNCRAAIFCSHLATLLVNFANRCHGALSSDDCDIASPDGGHNYCIAIICDLGKVLKSVVHSFLLNCSHSVIIL